MGRTFLVKQKLQPRLQNQRRHMQRRLKVTAQSFSGFVGFQELQYPTDNY